MRGFTGRLGSCLSMVVLLAGISVAAAGSPLRAGAATGPPSGRTWSVQPTPTIPNPAGQLAGISCRS
jgi:hypothetical protein